MIGYFLVPGNRRGFCYGSSVQYGEEHVSIRPTCTAYLPDLSHFIIFIGRREQSSAEVERSSLSLSLSIHPSNTNKTKGDLFLRTCIVLPAPSSDGRRISRASASTQTSCSHLMFCWKTLLKLNLSSWSKVEEKKDKGEGGDISLVYRERGQEAGHCHCSKSHNEPGASAQGPF